MSSQFPRKRVHSRKNQKPNRSFVSKKMDQTFNKINQTFFGSGPFVLFCKFLLEKSKLDRILGCCSSNRGGPGTLETYPTGFVSSWPLFFVHYESRFISRDSLDFFSLVQFNPSRSLVEEFPTQN